MSHQGYGRRVLEAWRQGRGSGEALIALEAKARVRRSLHLRPGLGRGIDCARGRGLGQGIDCARDRGLGRGVDSARGRELGWGEDCARGQGLGRGAGYAGAWGTSLFLFAAFSLLIWVSQFMVPNTTLPPFGTWTTKTQEDCHFLQKATTNPAKQGVSTSIPSPSTTLTLWIITLFPTQSE